MLRGGSALLLSPQLPVRCVSRFFIGKRPAYFGSGAAPGVSRMLPFSPIPLTRIARTAIAALAASTAIGLSPASAERVSNPVAEFTGVDKITGRIITFDVYIDETVQFGALQVTPRVCYSRPVTEEPKTDSFVEVDEITLDRKIRRIFTGWMFAESPGLNAVEHAVYDVWLKRCKQSSDVPAPKTN
jgi:hypothetical protein